MNTNFSAISDEYKTFVEEKQKCRKCPVFDHYKTIVNSEGNAKNPAVMFVAEAPGKDEVAQGRPLIGASGTLLRNILREYGFNRKNSILTNTIPCRPLNNVFPTDNKMVFECYSSWLEREIEILKPRIIVCLGAKATRILYDCNSLTEVRGRWKFCLDKNVWLFATWHPAYVLRKQDAMPAFRADLAIVRDEWSVKFCDHRFGRKD